MADGCVYTSNYHSPLCERAAVGRSQPVVVHVPLCKNMYTDILITVQVSEHPCL